jgi:hypothetical protein
MELIKDIVDQSKNSLFLLSLVTLSLLYLSLAPNRLLPFFASVIPVVLYSSNFPVVLGLDIKYLWRRSHLICP